MDEDYMCPQRQRIVLRSGCVYDAPIYLARFRFRGESPLGTYPKPEAYLDRIVAGMLQPLDEEWAPLTHAHRKLIEAAERKLAFEYHADSQALQLNGKTLLSGTPAMIMRKILLAYSSGQSVFDYRSFKYDSRIFSNPKATNFEVRLSRLRAKLAEVTPFARIEKTAEGEFAFRASCSVEFKESQ
jgi:hypothetical protein